MTLWEQCDGAAFIRPVAGEFYRLVESQEQVATLGYVDDLAEQVMLEELLEASKPPPVTDSPDLHYLLSTPFRYPPLKWGSRFGRKHERGMLYGGLSLSTTLAESAYYRFVFWYSMQSPLLVSSSSGAQVAKSIRSQHASFSAHYSTSHGVQLNQPPFDAHHSSLTHTSNYDACQQLGSDMRAGGVKAVEYASARCTEQGTCVGLFSPEALVDTTVDRITRWLCEMNADRVAFKPIGASAVFTFLIEQFQVKGRLFQPG